VVVAAAWLCTARKVVSYYTFLHVSCMFVWLPCCQGAMRMLAQLQAVCMVLVASSACARLVRVWCCWLLQGWESAVGCCCSSSFLLTCVGGPACWTLFS
jgi:hypothetical protein